MNTFRIHLDEISHLDEAVTTRGYEIQNFWFKNGIFAVDNLCDVRDFADRFRAASNAIERLCEKFAKNSTISVFAVAVGK